MPDESMTIEHMADGEEGHGPVAVFLSDTGTVAYFCRRDGTYWEGKLTVAPPPKPSAGQQDGQSFADSMVGGGAGGGVGVGPQGWRAEPLVAGDELISMEAAREIVRGFMP